MLWCFTRLCPLSVCQQLDRLNVGKHPCLGLRRIWACTSSCCHHYSQQVTRCYWVWQVVLVSAAAVCVLNIEQYLWRGTVALQWE